MTAIDLNTTKHHADRLFQRKRLIGFGIPAVIAVYFLYIFFAFDFAGLAQRANLENAVTLASDSWSHKVHVTRDNRSGETTYAVEGERKGRYPDGQRPEWVTGKDVISIDIGGDHIVRYLPQNRTEIDIPGMALIKVQAKGRKLTHNLPEDRPDWISVSDRRIGIVTPEGRITMTGARTEVFNYFPGWELFWFTLDSPYHGQSVASIMFGERLDPARSNINGAL